MLLFRERHLGTKVWVEAHKGQGTHKREWAERAQLDMVRGAVVAGFVLAPLVNLHGVSCDAVQVQYVEGQLFLSVTLRGGPGTRPAIKCWQTHDKVMPRDIIAPVRVWGLAQQQILTRLQLPWREEEV